MKVNKSYMKQLLQNIFNKKKQRIITTEFYDSIKLIALVKKEEYF
jgi:hypothetical protein